MKKRDLVPAALAFASLLIALPSGAQTRKVIVSPDGELQAVVSANSTGESTVQIKRGDERILLTRDDRSADGTHGYGVHNAAWTADSRFFVASTAASGGHQPWSRPIWVWSRAKNRIFELSKLGFPAVADFTLKLPATLTTKILPCPGSTTDRSVTIALNKLESDIPAPLAPCPDR